MLSRLAGTLAAVALMGLGLVPAVGAFELTGCELTLRSNDETGATLSSASGPGSGGTLDEPLLVHPLGIVQYAGRTQSVIQDHGWHVDVYGVPILSGGHPNAGGETTGSGQVAVAQYPLDRMAGLYPVSGTIAGRGGSCVGSGWVKLTTDPVGSIPWLLGLAFAALGLVTLYFATPRWRSTPLVGSETSVVRS